MEIQLMSWRLQGFRTVLDMAQEELSDIYKQTQEKIARSKKALNLIYFQLNHQQIDENEAVNRLICVSSNLCKAASGCIHGLAHRTTLIQNTDSGGNVKLHPESFNMVQAGMCCSILECILTKANRLVFKNSQDQYQFNCEIGDIEAMLNRFKNDLDGVTLTMLNKYALIKIHDKCITVYVNGINKIIKQ